MSDEVKKELITKDSKKSFNEDVFIADGLFFGEEARTKLIAGSNKVARAVSTTLGARGNNVVINIGNNPVVTKDGVTVANTIKLSDRVEEMGASLIKEATRKVSMDGGDGTTTATVIADAIIMEGMTMANKFNPVFLKRGMDIALDETLKSIEKFKKDIESSDEVKQVASISANNDDKIGAVIAEAIEKAGREGLVTIKGGENVEDVIEITEGIEIGAGWASPNMITNNVSHQAVFKNPYILMYTGKITEWKQLSGIMNQVLALNNATNSSKGVIVIAKSIEEQALRTLELNHINGTLPCVAINAPDIHDNMINMMEDIALVTNSELYLETEEGSLEDALIGDLGTCEQITVGKYITEIISDTKLKDNEELQELINTRIESLKLEIEEEKEEMRLYVLRSRLAKLAGKISVISTGGSSDIDRAERAARMTDALHAARAAIADGIVPGGGVILVKAYNELNEWLIDNVIKDEAVLAGYNVVKEALLTPIKTILGNAKLTDNQIDDTIDEIIKNKIGGYDAYALSAVDDMFAAGVIDPAKVTATAVKQAVSIASVISSVSCVCL